MSDDGGWLLDAQCVPSPNCDDRPEGCEVSLIVVHGISLPPGEYGGRWIDDLFTNRLDPAAHPYFATVCAARVSAHVLIRRNGDLVQYVPFHRRAWHAGPSRYRSQEACNDFAIGVELEGQDHEAYERIQYQRLALLVGVLRARFPGIGPADIVGHCHIAPGRKTDPGPAFDWARLRSLLA
ncbi:MAG: 1,6-anhydro-N-acetylmuramyl-L-alanine amidase AmpD [Gammaproteobacteria bacterium]